MNKDSNGTMLTSRAFARLLALVLAVATVAVYTLPVSVIGSSGGSAPQDTGAATAAPQGEEQTEQALHTVLFNLPEGYAYEDGTTTFSLLVKDGNVVPQGGIPAAPAARDGYAFAGWKIVSGDGTSEILTPEAITTKNVTLDTLYTAVYDKAENVSEESGEEAASEDTDAAPAEEAKPADDAAAEDTPAADETADPAAAEGEAPVEGETPAEDALTDEEAAAAAEAAAAEESGKTKSGIEPMAAYFAGSWTALKNRVETNGGTNGSVAGDVITLNGDAWCNSNDVGDRAISVTKDLTIIGKQGNTQHYFAGNNANNPAYFNVAAGVTLTLQDTQVLDNTFYVTGPGKVVFKGTTDWRGVDV
ncbi:MAG: hypothetical protein LBR00_02525, partial [Clostridiales Family XIII bacterium]|nr:hypothetical protein [Clostridiales Family XIII bacterium]